MKKAAIIIARGESKRLPSKNFLNLCGKPMFQWNLEKALKLFTKVYVSSDSQFILDIAKGLGATVIKRPPSLALDNIPNIPVYQHALQFMEGVDIIVSLQANSPTLSIATIKKALRIMELSDIQELITVDKKLNVHGSIWALKRDRLENYGDPFKYKAEVFLLDDSIDVHNIDDFKLAEKELIEQSDEAS
jgi:CMP-N-acetylneuraminic acid synthetase